MDNRVQPVTGAAQRRKQRRMRSCGDTSRSASPLLWLQPCTTVQGLRCTKPTGTEDIPGRSGGSRAELRRTGQTQPSPGMRPAPLLEVAGPQGGLGAPAYPCGGVPSLVPVIMVQEAAHDDATIAFLLSQTLLAEKEAKEADLARKEQKGAREAPGHRVPFLFNSRVEVAAAW